MRWRERAAEAMDLLEAGYLSNKLVGRMSAGEQRRIMIARALVHRPQSCCWTSHRTRWTWPRSGSWRDALRKVAQQGTGILIVTHHLADICRRSTG